ncbi:MAG: hypothetical protein KDB73_13495 [Planctomycetes bacterium]|nr:hypothetical protein [Planctomycetota bacterium]
MHVESDGRTAGGDRSSSDATGAHTMHDMSSMPGMSGMSGGHDKHAGHSPEMFRRLFWWNLALSIPVVIFSKQFQEWFGYTIDGAWTEWVPPIFGTIIYFWGGQPFLKGARVELHDRQPGMMTLISLAITVAYGASIASSLGIGDMDFWWELAGLIVVMLLGHWQEMKAIGQAQGALQALAELLPDTAEKIVGDRIQTVPVSTLAVDDTVLVRPGGRAPADGTIVEGDASFDESMITGESRPIRRTTGDRVVGGTIARDSSVRIRVDAIGDDTALASIQRMVADAQTSDSRAQALADRARRDVGARDPCRGRRHPEQRDAARGPGTRAPRAGGFLEPVRGVLGHPLSRSRAAPRLDTGRRAGRDPQATAERPTPARRCHDGQGAADLPARRQALRLLGRGAAGSRSGPAWGSPAPGLDARRGARRDPRATTRGQVPGLPGGRGRRLQAGLGRHATVSDQLDAGGDCGGFRRRACEPGRCRAHEAKDAAQVARAMSCCRLERPDVLMPRRRRPRSHAPRHPGDQQPERVVTQPEPCILVPALRLLDARLQCVQLIQYANVPRVDPHGRCATSKVEDPVASASVATRPPRHRAPQVHNQGLHFVVCTSEHHAPPSSESALRTVRAPTRGPPSRAWQPCRSPRSRRSSRRPPPSGLRTASPAA